MTLPSMAVGGIVKTMIAVTVSLHPAAHHGSHSITVQPGDTLSSISQRVYGSSADWPALWWLTRAALTAVAPVAAPAAQPATTAVTSATPASATSSAVYSGSGSFQSCVI